MKITLVAVPLINTRFPPLSIASITAFMREQGHEVRSFDFNIETYHSVSQDLKEYWTYYKGFQWMDNSHFENYIYPNIIGKNVESWVKRILETNPEIVGISFTNSPSGQILAQKLKAAQPNVKIVIGGPICSKSYNRTDLLPNKTYDVVVHNEGELTFAELVKNYEQSGKFLPTLGASVLDDNNNVIFNGLREVQMDCDIFPTPDFTDFNFDLYCDADNPENIGREIPYWTSRGCPARCNFCMDYKMWDLRYRQKSPKRIVQEMEYLSHKYNSKNFMLIELIFNGHIPRMREMAQELINRNLKFKFWGHGRIDGRMDIETLSMLKQVGFHWFIFGLESASDKVLKNMRKGYTKEAAENVLTNIRSVGLNCSVNVIVGFPGEDWSDFRETIDFIFRHRKTIAFIPSVTDCYALPSSDIYEYPEKFNIKSNSDSDSKPDIYDWETTDGKNTPVVRKYRKEFILSLFKKMRFKLVGPTEEEYITVEQIPDPEIEFRKLYPEHP